MKKTISASIGGIVFNVEEDAHAKLAAYLDAVSASLKDSEGHNEIMSDIESRIAEILEQKAGSNRVITLVEVDQVIGIMGKPEDFGAATDGTKQQADNYAGIQYGTGRRRVYRDIDNKVIFGVCSGLSNHFGIDPIWLRLLFGLSIFLGGFGLILYILLAIITPKARTAAEKLEMMGEPVDVNNIRKIMEEEMAHVKKKVKTFGDDIKAGRGNDVKKRFGENLSDFFYSLMHESGSVIGSIIKFILIGIAALVGLVLIALLLGLLGSPTSGLNVIDIGTGNHHFVHYSFRTFFDMLVPGATKTMLLTGMFLFLGVPLLTLLVRIGRAIVGRKRPFQWFSITASILWAAGWIFLFIGISSAFSHFSVTDFTRNEVKVSTSSPKVLYIKMDNKWKDEDVVELDSLSLYITAQNEFRGTPSLCIEQSPDSDYHLVLTKMARGVNKLEADDYAEAVDYNYANHDSTLALDPYFTLEQDKGWRRQKLEMTLQVPLNKSIVLPEGIEHVLCSALHRKGHYMGGEKCTMTETGLVPYSSGKN